MDIDKKVLLIQNEIEDLLKQGKSLFASSSFQTHSIPMLHILSQIDNSIAIAFINTGYHFAETLSFRDQITDQLNLNLINVYSRVPRAEQVDCQRKFLYTSDPDYCCHINKVAPMNDLLVDYDVWINGIRAGQSENRKKMQTFEKAPHGSLRYHPMLRWSQSEIHQYRKKYQLPPHPLEESGYLSLSCQPCTKKVNNEILGDERLSRWYGLNKTECGLHTELVTK